MRKIQKDVTIVNQVTVYVSKDGIEFDNAESCKAYEKSEYATLNTKYRNLIVAHGDEFDIFGYGSDAILYDIIKVKTQKDADLVMQMYFFVNKYIDATNEYAIEANKSVQEALKEKDYLIIYRGSIDDAEKDYFGIEKTLTRTIQRIHDNVKKLIEIKAAKDKGTE